MFHKFLTVNKALSMTRIKITQKRSVINRPPNQKATMVALGLRKINHSVEHDNNAQIAEWFEL